MGIGFQDASEAEAAQPPELLLAESGIRVPKAAYGLSLNQIAALGLAGGEMALKLGEPSPVRSYAADISCAKGSPMVLFFAQRFCWVA